MRKWWRVNVRVVLASGLHADGQLNVTADTGDQALALVVEAHQEANPTALAVTPLSVSSMSLTKTYGR